MYCAPIPRTVGPTLTVEQVGLILGCRRRRVFQLLAEGILERAPRYGRALRILTTSVERALRPPEPKKRGARRAALSEAPPLLNPRDISL